MCTDHEFTQLTVDFKDVTNFVMNHVETGIPKLISQLDKSLTHVEFGTDQTRVKLEKLGIAVKDFKATYRSAFSDKPETSLGDLGFLSIQDVLDLNKAYNANVWANSKLWEKLESTLKKYISQIESKEKELLNLVDLDKKTIQENARLLQKEISMAISILAALKQSNVTFNYRRKELCRLGLNSIKSVLESKKGVK